jgi:phage tail sheath gpL-like
MAGPLVGRRQAAIFANVDSFGNATTLAETLNEERMQGVWMPTAASLPCVIAAAWCGRRASAESDSISSNLSSFSPDLVDLWPIVVPQKDRGDWVTDTEAEAALQVGLTPVQVRDTDSHPFVPLSITTHSNDASGNPDTRTLTTNYQAVPDAVADELQVWFPSSFPNKLLKPDPADGTLDGLPNNATTPNTIKALAKARLRQVFDSPELSHLENLDADYENWAFNVANGAPNRLNATMDITPAAWFTQVSGQVRQNTPGARA